MEPNISRIQRKEKILYHGLVKFSVGVFKFKILQ